MGSKASTGDGLHSAVAPLSSGAASYALAVTTASASITLTAGVYKAWLASGAASVGVFYKIGGAAAAPTNGGGAAANTFGMSGAEVERIALTGSETALHAILTSGAAADTLYLTRIG